MWTPTFSPTLGVVHVTIFWLARHHKNATRALMVDIFLWGPLITTENVTNSDCHRPHSSVYRSASMYQFVRPISVSPRLLLNRSDHANKWPPSG